MVERFPKPLVCINQSHENLQGMGGKCNFQNWKCISTNIANKNWRHVAPLKNDFNIKMNVPKITAVALILFWLIKNIFSSFKLRTIYMGFIFNHLILFYLFLQSNQFLIIRNLQRKVLTLCLNALNYRGITQKRIILSYYYKSISKVL